MNIRTIPALLLALTACSAWEHTEYARALDDALDSAEVDLATALAVPDHKFRDAVLVAGELDPWAHEFEADLWNGRDLLVVDLSLRGELADIDAYGYDASARNAAALVADSDISPYDAIAIAEDVVHAARAFAVAVDGSSYEVDVLADLHVYRLWVSPQDGDVLDIDDVSEHDCHCW